jgi:hypothetical protein
VRIGQLARDSVLLWLFSATMVFAQANTGQPDVDTNVEDIIDQIAYKFGYRIVLETPEFADAVVSGEVQETSVYEALASLLQGFDYTLVRDSALEYRLFILGVSETAAGGNFPSSDGSADFELVGGKPNPLLESTAVELYEYEINHDGPDGLSEGIPLPREGASRHTYRYEVNPDGPDGFSESIPIRTD